MSCRLNLTSPSGRTSMSISWNIIFFPETITGSEITNRILIHIMYLMLYYSTLNFLTNSSKFFPIFKISWVIKIHVKKHKKIIKISTPLRNICNITKQSAKTTKAAHNWSDICFLVWNIENGTLFSPHTCQFAIPFCLEGQSMKWKWCKFGKLLW
jgi:hypothetical protein